MLKNIPIKYKLLGIVLALVIINLITGGLVLCVIDCMKKDAEIMNIASMERSLIKDMSKYTTMISYGEDVKNVLKEKSDMFEKNLNTLLYGDKERGIPEASGEFKDQLLKVKKLWKEYKENINVVLESSPGDPNFLEAVNYIRNNSKVLFNEQNKAVMIYQKNSEEKIELVKTIVIIMMVIAIIIGALSYYVVKVAIIAPIMDLKRMLMEVVNGNYDVKPKIKFGNDELGDLEKCFLHMINKIKELIETIDSDRKAIRKTFKELREAMDRLAKGDLTVRLEVKDKRSKAQEAFNRAVESMQNLIKSLRQEIINLNKEINALREETQRAKETAEQVADAANQVAVAATDQSNKLQDLTQEVEETAKMAEDTLKAAEEGVEAMAVVDEKANEGVKNVENAIEAMQRIANIIDELGKALEELGKKSEKINEITALIKDIAEQTGLLALNASIEAARAGEAGRGFAVVASEIKGLAEEIGKSVDDINKTVEEIRSAIEKTIDLGLTGKEAVDRGVIVIDEVNNAFLKIKEAIDKANETIVRIQESAKNSKENVETALRHIQDIASISEEFAATAEELTASAEEMSRIVEEISKATEEISEISSRVSKEAEKFII
ncbi:methyl-accepting chemotaxis protein [Methanocaldococcus villosus]|uniref:methyl-accepting chemotaxis protein n=1 Tax=Methanocaldococcus villosus TaxID=667126 RepID=UPI0003612314|nr:methyl-accepting chemotaxis protein [Methanocaldococcus villosus]